MKAATSRIWKLMFLSIVLPMGLFTSLKLSGIVGHQPNIAETIIPNNTIYWRGQRPDYTVGIGDNLSSNYSYDINLSQSVTVGSYEDSEDGGPLVSLCMNVSALVSSGYVYEINLTANRQGSTATSSNIWWDSPPAPATGLTSEGLSAIEVSSPNKGITVEAMGFGSGSPESTFLLWPFNWGFQGSVDDDYMLKLISNVVYYNGSVFNSVVQDFLLQINPATNNTFNTAVNLQPGNYSRLFLDEPPGSAYYGLNAVEGQRINFSVESQTSELVGFYVRIYNPDGAVALLMTTPAEASRISGDFLANATGNYGMQITALQGLHGFYSIEVSSS